MNQFKRWPSRPTRGRFIPSIVLTPLLSILLLPSAALGQPRSIQSAVPDHHAALHEGVVLAPRYGFAYVMRPGGGIDAVDLASGAVRWRSDSAAKPLALAGDRLIAQKEGRGGNALDLVALDARSGADRDSIRIPLPSGVAATVLDTPSGFFRVQADGSGSELVVRWEATNMGTAQGYMPAENEGQAPTIVTGAAVLDLAAPSLKVKSEPSVRLAQSASLSRASLEELHTPVVAGEGRQMLSADGRHVLVTQPMDVTDKLYRHRWTVYERNGTRLGSVPALVSAAPFLVVGTTLYHTAPAHALVREGRLVERPFALRAVNLATGAEAWTKAAGETDFRGPFPP